MKKKKHENGTKLKCEIQLRYSKHNHPKFVRAYWFSDVFKKFKNEQGNFNETLFGDVEGMISLFEVTHMRIHGEDILDEAFVFTSSHLEMMTPQLSLSLAAKVNHSLKWPLFKNLPRLVARYYISTYEEDPSHDATLLLLAKLDFNLLQKQHKKEAGELSK